MRLLCSFEAKARCARRLGLDASHLLTARAKPHSCLSPFAFRLAPALLGPSAHRRPSSALGREWSVHRCAATTARLFALNAAAAAKGAACPVRYSWYSRSGTGSRYCRRVAAGLAPAGVAARRGPAGGPRRCVYERPPAIEIGTRSGSHSAVPALRRRSDLDGWSTAAVRNPACTEHCGPLKFARTCTHARKCMHAQPAGARSHDSLSAVHSLAQIGRSPARPQRAASGSARGSRAGHA